MSFFSENKFTESDFTKKITIFPANEPICFRIVKVEINEDRKYMRVETTPERSYVYIAKKFSFFFRNGRKAELLALLKTFYTQQEIISGEWSKKLGEMIGQAFVVEFGEAKKVGENTYQNIKERTLKILLDDAEPVEDGKEIEEELDAVVNAKGEQVQVDEDMTKIPVKKGF